MIPIRIFFDGQDDLPQKFDGVLNPFLFVLPILAFKGFRKSADMIGTEKAILGIFSVLFVLFAFFKTDMRIRYIAPVIPPLIILAVFGLRQASLALLRLLQTQARWKATACWLSIVVAALGMNFHYLIRQYRQVDPFSYISGRVNRDDYIKRYRPEYPLIQWSNRHLAPDAVILCLFLGNRQYYSDRDMRFGDHYFVRRVKAADSAEDLCAGLRQNGVTHVMIRFDLFNYTFSNQISERQKQILQIFLNEHLTALVTEFGYGLYRLDPAEPF